MDLSLIKKEY